MTRRDVELGLIAALIVLVPALAMATETVNYSYDAKGRLVGVARSGTNNVVTNYTYDHADNRTNKTTTGSPNPGPP
jgi:hypothetical protein